MQARFFARPISPLVNSFVCGFLGGYTSGQGHAILETNVDNQNSRLLGSAPGIVALMGIGMAIMDRDFRWDQLTDHALATVLGFTAGFFIGYYSTKPAMKLTTPRI